MQINIREQGEVTILDLAGEIRLDDERGDSLQDAVRSQIEAGKKSVLLNFKNLDFIDSSGLGAFLMCIRKLRSDGGEMKICGMTSPVKALFELVRMHRVCHVTETVDEAVEAFQN